MKFVYYLENGIMVNSLPKGYDKFYIAEDIDSISSVSRYFYPGDNMQYILEALCVELYDVFRDAIFPSQEDYYKDYDVQPQWISRAGLDSDFDMSQKELINCFSIPIHDKMAEIGVEDKTLLQTYKEIETKKFKYAYTADCQSLVNTLQELLMGIHSSFVGFYKQLCTLNNVPKMDGIYFECSTESRMVYNFLYSFIIQIYSTFDILTKIAYELENIKSSENTYVKMAAGKILYEIKNVVEAVVQEKRDVKTDFVDCVSNETLEAFCKANSFYQNHKTYNALFDLLLKEHEKLIEALSIYMHEYVAKKEVKQISFIKNTVFDKVLSFNYTDTYATNYDSNIDCCYIHGKATVDKKIPCNMVLGIDDHYINDASVVPEIIPFEKYYQRIINRTDNQYFEWLEKMKTEENTVYIYGHSLAPADGDVLGQFILSANTKTVIYYLNEYDRAEKVKNLAIILGPNTLIQLTGGKNPVISFEKIK